MFALFVALHAAEVTTYSVDAVCYEHTSKFCPMLQASAEAGGGEEAGTEAAIRLNQFIYATPSNASSALAKSNAQVVMFTVQDDMSGKDQDIFDLAVLSENVMLFAPLQGDEEGSGAMMKNLLAQIGKVGTNTRDFQSLAKGAMALSQPDRRKRLNIQHGSEHPLVRADSDLNPWAKSIHLTASSDVFSKVNGIYAIDQNFVIHADIHIPFACFLSYAHLKMENTQYFKADYIMSPVDVCSMPGYETLTFKNLGLISEDPQATVESIYYKTQLDKA